MTSPDSINYSVRQWFSNFVLHGTLECFINFWSTLHIVICTNNEFYSQ